ncbi:MAG: DUF951 domain-containing protein [Clostridia bacterium]|nr:DUF951 domain-containing protein [Clostridia bacterium]
MNRLKIVKFVKDDILVMKKKHPCGSERFKVLRAGSDVRILCLGCGRDTELPRMKLEKNIRSVITATHENAKSDAPTSE